MNGSSFLSMEVFNGAKCFELFNRSSVSVHRPQDDGSAQLEYRNSPSTGNDQNHNRYKRRNNRLNRLNLHRRHHFKNIRLKLLFLTHTFNERRKIWFCKTEIASLKRKLFYMFLSIYYTKYVQCDDDVHMRSKHVAPFNTYILYYVDCYYVQIVLITSLTHFLMCLFHLSTFFKQPSAHHKENQLYQYIIWYISLCVGGRLVCRSETATYTE